MSLFCALLFLFSNITTENHSQSSVLVLKQAGKERGEWVSRQYLELLEGFQEGASQLKRPLHLKIVDIHEPEQLARLRPEDFSLVVCLGTRPAILARDRFAQSPMIYAMVLNPNRHGLEHLSPSPNQGTQGGILARIDPLEYVAQIVQFHPGVKKIGILYKNVFFKTYAEEIQRATRRAGLELSIRVVESKRDLVPKFNAMLDEDIDLFLMLPDTEIFEKAHRYIFLETIKRDIPVMGPSSNYVKAGALWGVVLSPYDIGLQTAEMMEKALDGQRLSIEYPRRNKLTLNYIVAEKLEIQFPQKLILKARNEGRLVE